MFLRPFFALQRFRRNAWGPKSTELFFSCSYDDVPKYQTSPSCWDESSLNGDSRFLSDYKHPNTSSRILLPPELTTILRDDHTSAANLQPSPGTNFSRSRRNSLGDFTSLSSSNKHTTANGSENRKHSNLVVPMTDTRPSVQSHSKPKSGVSLSWLFRGINKKKHKNVESSPNRLVESDEASFRDSGTKVIEALRKELTEANERRDQALTEVSEMKSSVSELQEKLEYLENYCEELKKALDQAMLQAKDSDDPRAMNRTKPVDLSNESVSVNNEAMVEGFMQMVSEGRSSVKHFCKTLVAQIDEGDTGLLENVNAVLQTHKLSINSKISKVALCHLEAVINQSLYQDFENCVFQKNGSPRLLDPQQERQAQFSSFCALRNLSWNEVLRKGTKYYSEEFSRFCDQKMSIIVTSLNWTRPWPEPLLQTFFVAAKCIWLLHLLAFSFSPALGILRVEDNRSFDGAFMEDVFVDRQRAQNPTRVKVMVMPGFYMQDRVLRCKVLWLKVGPTRIHNSDRVNFRFALCGLVTLTVLPQTFKNSHFPPIVYYDFSILLLAGSKMKKTDNLDGVRGGEQNGKTIANYWRKMTIF
ncbi:putative rasGAP protein [Helianthus anomalus]